MTMLATIALSAAAIATLIAGLAAGRGPRHPHHGPRDGVPPVSARAMRNLTARLDRERLEHPGRQA